MGSTSFGGDSDDWGWDDEDNNDEEGGGQVEMAVSHDWGVTTPAKRRGGSPTAANRLGSRTGSGHSRNSSGGGGGGGAAQYSPTNSMFGTSGPATSTSTSTATQPAQPKGMRLSQPLLGPAPSSASPPPSLRKAAPAPTPPPEDDIFAELGLAAHPTFSHQAPATTGNVTQRNPFATTTAKTTTGFASVPTAPTASGPWRGATTASTAASRPLVATTTAATARAPVSAPAADPFDNDDDDGFKDDWGDDGDLDDLLKD